MANYAASGGYYISTNAERIFAQPTTLTGSIGVYGIKFDASQWAKSYGIRSDYYPHGSHGATVHPLTPLTQNMKLNLDRTTLGYYDYFKSIVAKGRSLSPQQVERIAQGRVWTGEQAKEVGLVDAIGGLERAISYAKSAHTTTEKVQVEYWPKKSSPLESLTEMISENESCIEILRVCLAIARGDESAGNAGVVEAFLENATGLKFAQRPHFMLTMDEKTAIDLVVLGG
jgi:protease-4